MFNEVFLIKQLVWFNKRPKFLFWALFVILSSCNAPASPNQNYDDYTNNDADSLSTHANVHVYSSDDTVHQIKLKYFSIRGKARIDLGDSNFKGIFKKGK